MSRDEIIDAVRRIKKPRMYEARYRGVCPWCRGWIKIGTVIAHSSDPRGRYTLHSGCFAEAWLIVRDGAA